jgi:signal transduction histidine kinase
LDPPQIPEEAAGRISWFIRLRWLAAIGVPLFAIIGHVVLGLRIAIWSFVIVGASIALYNGVFLFLSRLKRSQGKWGKKLARAQVATDIVALTFLMHIGGGIENPFISYYLFHTIIASILLPWQKVTQQVVFASVCIAAVAIAELTGFIPHHHIEGLWTVEVSSNWKFVLVALFAIITTLCVTALLAGSIAQRLHQREGQLARANDVLAEQDRIKSRYVMRVAHDLAEPAGMITSCLKVVTQGLAGTIPEKALDMVQRAQEKSEYLGHLIRDLLSLSRIKAARKVPKRQVDLSQVLKQVLEDLEPHVAEKNVTVEQNLPADLPTVYGNPDAIHELFGNLVANAIKYTFVQGLVQVSASNSGDNVLVKVQDNGIGIPPDAMPHVFEEFYRADNVKAESFVGTGLGLSIVKQILNVHAGEIWVESEQDKGTTFSFTLPTSEQDHA